MWYFEPKITNYKYDYPAMAEYLNGAEWTKAIKLLRRYGAEDLFFLMYFILDVRPVNHPWLISKIYDIQERHDRTLDLWAREHFKSTILTFGLPIWEIINNPETRIGIFSNTRALAKKFMRRIKQELENNERLHRIWPEIFYDNPQRKSPKWSEDDGLLTKRKRSFAEMTIEAWGITDGLPVGPHYPIRIYDDIVSEQSVKTSEQIEKTRDGFAMSHNLGEYGGSMRVIGTRYNFNDEYSVMLEKDTYTPRIYSGTAEPKFWDDATLKMKLEDMGPYVFSCQIELKPVSEDEQKFSVDDIKWEERCDADLNVYILVDPAGDPAKKKGHSSYTVMWAVGVDEFKNIHILDIVRDKLDLHGRWTALAGLVRKHRDNLKEIGYERYSMQGDLNYINRMKIEEKFYFKDPVELGGSMSKDDRIRNLIPYFFRGQMYFPREYWYSNWQGERRDLVKDFLQDEFQNFPNVKYKDMLDALARINDIEFTAPMKRSVVKKQGMHSDFKTETSVGTWMGYG